VDNVKRRSCGSIEALQVRSRYTQLAGSFAQPLRRVDNKTAVLESHTYELYPGASCSSVDNCSRYTAAALFGASSPPSFEAFCSSSACCWSQGLNRRPGESSTWLSIVYCCTYKRNVATRSCLVRRCSPVSNARSPYRCRCYALNVASSPTHTTTTCDATSP